MPFQFDRASRFAAVAACIVALPASAQRVVTAADYEHAVQGMSNQAVTDLAAAGRVSPNWLADGRFWYRDGDDFIVVNPVRKTREPAFDRVRLAAALARATGKPVAADHLPFTTIGFAKDGKSVVVTVDAKQWTCDARGSKCAPTRTGSEIAPVTESPFAGGGRGRGAFGGRGGFGAGPMSSHNEPLTMAPDGKKGVFVHDWNLWVKDVSSGQERQLTNDGVENDGYATDNAGWVRSDRAVVLWSPDSKMIATQQQDQRNDGDMYLVTTPTGGRYSANGRQGGHPVLEDWKYPLPGDSVVTMIHRLVINVDNGKMVKFEMPADQHRGTVVDNLNMSDLSWNPDDSQLAFASVSRDHKKVWVRVADAATGAVRTVFEEDSPTQFESGPGQTILWRVLWPSKEVLWYSERDNWGHFYLYDLTTGQLKNKVTPGDGVVTGIIRIDDTTRTLWFSAVGREAGENPYYTHYYRVNFDGTHMVTLTPGNGTHEAEFEPSGKYLVDTWSQSDVPYTSVLRDATTGAQVLPLEKAADTAAMKAAGWNPVTTIKMKARDGTTDIYGVMFKPDNFDPNKKYPIINNIYPGPQSGSNGQWGFFPSGGEAQGLADLGFIVVKINGMGTPDRDKKFHDAYYAHMGDNTLPDQVAGMKQLAQENSWIDIDKAGIWGHSGGGFAAADAMFRYPDFFKVGISESGNHDNREYEDDWGERYQGLLTDNADGTDNYTAEANENYAKNLKGHLLLAHGSVDNNVPPYNTLLVVDALIKANKDFDLLFLPNQVHGYGAESQYMQRRRWDYWVRYLMGGTPPTEFDMNAAISAASGGGGRGGRGGRGAPPAP
jgi:dipeptidyl aminopeptidase/acylaminoacyl peptidase